MFVCGVGDCLLLRGNDKTVLQKQTEGVTKFLKTVKSFEPQGKESWEKWEWMHTRLLSVCAKEAHNTDGKYCQAISPIEMCRQNVCPKSEEEGMALLKNRFSAHEEQVLTDLVEELGEDWAAIHARWEGRAAVGDVPPREKRAPVPQTNTDEQGNVMRHFPAFSLHIP